jgi:hypothetical protein
MQVARVQKGRIDSGECVSGDEDVPTEREMGWRDLDIACDDHSPRMMRCPCWVKGKVEGVRGPTAEGGEVFIKSDLGQDGEDRGRAVEVGSTFTSLTRPQGNETAEKRWVMQVDEDGSVDVGSRGEQEAFHAKSKKKSYSTTFLNSLNTIHICIMCLLMPH